MRIVIQDFGTERSGACYLTMGTEGAELVTQFWDRKGWGLLVCGMEMGGTCYLVCGTGGVTKLLCGMGEGFVTQSVVQGAELVALCCGGRGLLLCLWYGGGACYSVVRWEVVTRFVVLRWRGPWGRRSGPWCAAA